MTNIYNIADRLKKAGNTTFTKDELSHIITIYSNNVSNGNWRDYALDCTTNMAVFSIFRNSQDNALYTITKHIDKKKNLKFILHKQGKKIIEGESINNILDILKG